MVDQLSYVVVVFRRCKFKHPSPEELEETVNVSSNGIAYEFCHDFQNSQCQRSNCRSEVLRIAKYQLKLTGQSGKA